MKKSEVVVKVANRTGVAAHDVSMVVESFLDVLQQEMSKGTNIYIRQFGTFQVVKRKAKLARNISTDTTMVVPERFVPCFKPAPIFKEMVQSGVYQETTRHKNTPRRRLVKKHDEKKQKEFTKALTTTLAKVTNLTGVSFEEIVSNSKVRDVAAVRRVFSYIAWENGIPTRAIADFMNYDASCITQHVHVTKRLIEQRDYDTIRMLKHLNNNGN